MCVRSMLGRWINRWALEGSTPLNVGSERLEGWELKCSHSSVRSCVGQRVLIQGFVTKYIPQLLGIKSVVEHCSKALSQEAYLPFHFYCIPYPYILCVMDHLFPLIMPNEIQTLHLIFLLASSYQLSYLYSLVRSFLLSSDYKNYCLTEVLSIFLHCTHDFTEWWCNTQW